MRNEFWIVSSLISIGVIGGFIYNWPVSSNTGADRQFPDSKVNVSVAPESVSPYDLEQYASRVDELWRQGDNFLGVGNLDDAMENYAIMLNLHEKVHGQESTDIKLQFRIALTSELQSEFERADYFYRQILADETLDFERQLFVQLAQTRNLAKLGKQSQAAETLSTLYLLHAGDESINNLLRFEIGHQIVQLVQAEAEALNTDGVAVLEQPLFEGCPIDSRSAIDVIDRELSETRPKDQSLFAAKPLEILQNPTGDVGLIIVSGAYKSTSITKMLTDLGQGTNLQFEMDAEVQPYLIGRTAKFQFSAVSLGVLLDVTLHPLNLIWEQNGNKVKLSPAGKVSPERLGQYRARQAIRVGRDLIVNYPNDPCRDAILLAGANMNYLIGGFDEASTILNQLLEKELAGELKAKVLLNIGLIEKKFQRYDNAIELFLGAADQSLDRELQAIAYANMARLHLERGYIDPAIIAGGRSLSLTKNLRVRGSAALDMSRSYLINRDPQLANRVLFDHRDAFAEGLILKIAQVFGAYARYLGTINSVAKERAIETLVLSLADIETKKLSNSVDRIIIAKAYNSIGLPNQAIETLIITNARPENLNWERTRTFELAGLLRQYGNKKAAISNYQKLIRDLTDEIGKRSLLKLAEFKLDNENDPDGCLQLCARLWELDARQASGAESKLSETIKTVVLRLMGRAYTAKGDFDSAVYCYSGRLPLRLSNAENGAMVN